MDSCILHTKTAEETQKTGFSLASTLYAQPVTITLRGELGAGKTTFLQGFGRGLGLGEHLVSPTYALEQRYDTPLGPLLHLDLYRLGTADAHRLLLASDDHPGIRCIEWPERVPDEDFEEIALIDIGITEEAGGRCIHCVFDDASLPTRAQILAWRTECMLQPHIAAHCDAVGACAQRLGDLLASRHQLVRRKALLRAGEVHDLLRFLDFRPEGAPPSIAATPEQETCWARWKERYPGLRHEEACAAFLRAHRHTTLAAIVEPHGLAPSRLPRTRIEQKLLYYADKRVRDDTIVTLDERFADFAVRYANGSITSKQQEWLSQAKSTEHELFPDGPPLTISTAPTDRPELAQATGPRAAG